jgi:2-keto-3-deoxy-L-rhamnonate aldolase RhmA
MLGGNKNEVFVSNANRCCSFLALALPSVPVGAQSQDSGAAKAKLYNTTKQKLLDGKQVFSFTQSKMDIADYCERAKHYDFTWFEMQHSTLEFADIEKMIAACPHVKATPMIRLPDAQEWHIQHATDIGALGVIVPTVDDVDRAREAAKWSRYPPVARRSTGQGQAASIWGINGINYHQTINDNMLVVIMIETPTGVANAYDIASVPGVDVVIIGNNDLSWFSGIRADRRTLSPAGGEGSRRYAAGGKDLRPGQRDVCDRPIQQGFLFLPEWSVQ